MSGNLLPTQLIYAGKTNKCHPNINFPAAWNITHTDSHWSTEKSMLEYVDKVLQPYFSNQRRLLGLQEDHRGLLVLDVFAAHRGELFLQALDRIGVSVRFVPASCTSDLQPLDVAVNDVIKKKLKSKFSEFYAKKVQVALTNGENIENVKIDLSTSNMKIVNARWLVSVMIDISHQHDLIKSAFQLAGISDAVKDVLPQVEEQNIERPGIFDVLMAKK